MTAQGNACLLLSLAIATFWGLVAFIVCHHCGQANYPKSEYLKRQRYEKRKHQWIEVGLLVVSSEDAGGE